MLKRANLHADSSQEPINRDDWFIPCALAVFLVFISFHNYLLFHFAAELFAIMVAILLSMVAWQTYTFSRNHFLMYLGCGYFWIGALDGVHALIYKGMEVYPIATANPSAQFWIATRYSEALLLLTAPLFLNRAVAKYGFITAFGGIAVALYALIMTGNFPDAFIEGQGLTPFKVASEYVIIALLAGALAHLAGKREHLKPNVFGLLATSIVLTMLAELSFTFYVNVYGLSNLVGHIFKIFSFWLIFIAVIRSSLKEPYLVLRESERRYRQLFENASDSIFIIDPETLCLLDVNELTAKRLGYTREELVGMKIADINSPKSRDTIPNTIKELRNNGSIVIEMEHLRKDGSVMPVEISSRVNHIGGRKVFQSFARDITKRKQAEVQLIQSSKLATLGELASSTAHELNQPLSIIGLTAENTLARLNENEIGKGELNNKLEIITLQAKRMADIINHMGLFSRKDDSAPELFDVCKTVRDSIEMVDEQFRISNIEMDVNLPSECACRGCVLGYPHQLEQVLLNLLANARNAINKHVEDVGSINGAFIPKVRVSLKEVEAGGAIMITVANTGAKISETVMDKIFDPFFTTGDKGQGTGLGLSISQSIINKMNGRIEVHNNDDGASFHVILPVAPDGEKLEGRPPRDAAREITTEKSISGSLKVLLVDDEEEIANELSDFLRRKGFDTATAHNGRNALAVLETFHADLVVADMLMPEMNGMELLKRLQKRSPSLPVIISTGDANPAREQEIINEGASAVIRKPVKLREILTAINNLF